MAAAAPPLGPGLWGGPDGELNVTAAGATLRLGCGEGSLGVTLRPDADGRFSERGRFDAGQGGPQAVDETPGGRAASATFAGRITGDAMALEVRVDGAAAPLRLALERGRRSKLIRCH
jgi:hypothetical protein